MPWSELGRVLIVSPHPLFREGIVRLLGDQVEVVGAVASWQEARDAIRKHRPQAIIVDHENVELKEADLAPLLWPEVESIRVIYVTLAGNQMIIHDRQRVVGATEVDLLRALKNAHRKRESKEETDVTPRALGIPEGGGIMKKLGIPILLTIVFSVPVALWFGRSDLTLRLAGRQGQHVDQLLRVEFSIAGVIFVLCMVFLLYSVFAFRRAPGDTEDGPPIEGSTPLEIAWTIVPAIIVFGLATYTVGVLRNITQPPSSQQELVVDVTGFQWAWRFEYPDLGIKSSELVLPVNQPVLFRLHATDVIHSFWVPEFRIKMDAIPGIENRVRLTPTKVGQFKVRCAELCGTGHAYMLANVKVMKEADFKDWVAHERGEAQPKPAEANLAKGRQLVEKLGCLGCHSTDGTPKVGPTWKGLYESTVTLQDGTTVKADDEYLRRSILDPGAQIVKGFPDVMPKNFKDQLSEDDLKAIVEYIESLK